MPIGIKSFWAATLTATVLCAVLQSASFLTSSVLLIPQILQPESYLYTSFSANSITYRPVLQPNSDGQAAIFGVQVSNRLPAKEIIQVVYDLTEQTTKLHTFKEIGIRYGDPDHNVVWETATASIGVNALSSVSVSSDGTKRYIVAFCKDLDSICIVQSTSRGVNSAVPIAAESAAQAGVALGFAALDDESDPSAPVLYLVTLQNRITTVHVDTGKPSNRPDIPLSSPVMSISVSTRSKQMQLVVVTLDGAVSRFSLHNHSLISSHNSSLFDDASDTAFFSCSMYADRDMIACPKCSQKHGLEDLDIKKLSDGSIIETIPSDVFSQDLVIPSISFLSIEMPQGQTLLVAVVLLFFVGFLSKGIHFFLVHREEFGIKEQIVIPTFENAVKPRIDNRIQVSEVDFRIFLRKHPQLLLRDNDYKMLLYAAECDRLDIIEVLLEDFHVDVNKAPHRDGRTVLCLLAELLEREEYQGGEPFGELIRYLLTNGANSDIICSCRAKQWNNQSPKQRSPRIRALWKDELAKVLRNIPFSEVKKTYVHGTENKSRQVFRADITKKSIRKLNGGKPLPLALIQVFIQGTGPKQIVAGAKCYERTQT